MITSSDFDICYNRLYTQAHTPNEYRHNVVYGQQLLRRHVAVLDLQVVLDVAKVVEDNLVLEFDVPIDEFNATSSMISFTFNLFIKSLFLCSCSPTATSENIV